VIAIEDSVLTAAVTVTVVLAVIPLKVALIVALPAATAVTTPAAFTVAAAEFPLRHVAVVVTFAVEPSL
jgi:hypothetical protein